MTVAKQYEQEMNKVSKSSARFSRQFRAHVYRRRR